MPITVHHIPACPFCQRLEILLAPWPPRDKYGVSATDAEPGLRSSGLTQVRPEISSIARG